MENIKRQLPALTLPQMSKENVVSINDVEVGGGVFIIVPPYTTAKYGDTLWVKWDGINVREMLITNPSKQLPIALVVERGVAIGKHMVSYEVRDQAGNMSYGPVIDLRIEDVGAENKYPPPVFADASGGIITQASIQSNAGTHLKVYPYTGIAIGHEVTLYWRGLDKDGKDKESIVLQSVVGSGDLRSGLNFIIPADKFSSAIAGGSCSAFYQVKANAVVQGLSESASVSIEKDGGGVMPAILDMQVSTGAAITDFKAINVYPFNQGVVTGTPGASVSLHLSGEKVEFAESGTKYYLAALDMEGKASFRVRAFDIGAVTIMAYETHAPGNIVTRFTSFGNYKSGVGSIMYLNNTTAAVCDGVTPCSIYLKTAGPSFNDITKVHVIVSGAAVIDGYDTNVADILLNKDRSAEIDIVSTSPGRVVVELSLPEASGSLNRLSVNFV